LLFLNNKKCGKEKKEEIALSLEKIIFLKIGIVSIRSLDLD